MLAVSIYIPESGEFYEAAPPSPLKLSESERKVQKEPWWWPVVASGGNACVPEGAEGWPEAGGRNLVQACFVGHGTLSDFLQK